jgi:hypothetical protein
MDFALSAPKQMLMITTVFELLFVKMAAWKWPVLFWTKKNCSVNLCLCMSRYFREKYVNA